MATQYPNLLDTTLSLPKVFDGISPILADDVNRIRDAVVVIQTELGTNPSSTFGSLVERLDNFLASEVALADADGYYISTNVEDAFREVGESLEILAASFKAANVSVEDVDGYFVATDVEAALKELFLLFDGSNEASEIPIADIDGYFGATTVEDALAELAGGTAVQIGDPEDATYTDGLFTDFTANTRLGVTIDRFNEVLKSLAPSPAPSLADASFTSGAGPAAKVSFGTSNAIGGYTNVGTAGGGAALDINGTFTAGGTTALRQGAFNNSTAQSGVLADAIPADTGTPNPAYPANAFGDADQGLLQMWVNGVKIHEEDLSTFGSGTTTTAGTGFVLSVATDALFPNGDVFEIFKNRTGTWQVDPAHQIDGWNYCQSIHVVGATMNTTNFFEWVVDADVTATTYAGILMDNLIMAGSAHISGVEYHTSGTADYDITVNNVHRNTYSTSGSAISHPTTTNCSIASTSLGAIATEADTEIITNQTVTVDSGRILNGSITVTTRADRTVQSDVTSSSASIAGILVDTNTDNSTATNETLNGEDYRVPSNRSLTDTTGFTAGGAGLWDSTISLVSATAGYSDGLLQYNGQLFYPNDGSVTNSGNFSTITNGPAGNVNYSAASGARVYWRYYHFGSATSNFILRVTGNGTVVDAGSVSGSTNQFSVEFLLPNTTQNGGATIEFKDANIAFTDINSIGCFASTFGTNVGDTSAADWGISFGSRNTSTSENGVIIRIVAGDGWTGDLTRLEFVAA